MLGLDGGNGAGGGAHTRIVQPPARSPDRHAPGPGGPGPPGPGGPGLEHRPPAPGGRQGASTHGPHRQSHTRLPSPPPHRSMRHAQLPSRRPRRPAIRNQLHRPQAHLISDPHPTRHINHSSEPVMVQPPPDTKLHFRVRSARFGAGGRPGRPSPWPAGPVRSPGCPLWSSPGLGRPSQRPVPATDRPVAPFPGVRSDAGCPNLPQRPGSSRSAREESLIFRAFLRGRSRPGAPLWQIWTRPRPGSPQEPHQYHTAPVHPPYCADPGS